MLWFLNCATKYAMIYVTLFFGVFFLNYLNFLWNPITLTSVSAVVCISLDLLYSILFSVLLFFHSTPTTNTTTYTTTTTLLIYYYTTTTTTTTILLYYYHYYYYYTTILLLLLYYYATIPLLLLYYYYTTILLLYYYYYYYYYCLLSPKIAQFIKSSNLNRNCAYEFNNDASSNQTNQSALNQNPIANNVSAQAQAEALSRTFKSELEEILVRNAQHTSFPLRS